MGHQSDWRGIDNSGYLRENYSRPVAPGKAAPDVMINLRIAGFLCGLGEIGYSKMLLTPEFGPRVRVGIIITELELEPDPIMEPGTLCNRCMACANQCPSGCIPKDPSKSVKVTVAGKELEWADVDEPTCSRTFFGGLPVEKGDPSGTYMQGARADYKPADFTPFYHKPSNLYNSGQAVCGAAGCTRACKISMESRGVLKNKFHNKFRTEKPWKMDWSPEGLAADQPVDYTPPYGAGYTDVKFFTEDDKAD
jgi:ferredoxin